MSINSIQTAQIGAHPLLTTLPIAYPLIKTAEVVAKAYKFSSILPSGSMLSG
jgi:hypothetical protein